MTHTDDALRERVAEVIDSTADVDVVAKGWETFFGQLNNADEIADAAIAAVHADIAARAMSDEVVEAVASKSGRSHGLVKIVTHQMLRELGIAESEAER